MPFAEAAAAITDSGRPVPTTIRSNLVGSIGGYDEASSLMVARVVDSLTRLGWKMRRRWREDFKLWSKQLLSFHSKSQWAHNYKK